MADETAVNTTSPAAEETTTPVLTEGEDLEAKFKQLEEEKNKAIEEASNWKLAALKNKSKENLEDESDDDKIRRISREELASSKVVEIAREQDGIIQRALKENKELKLANLNKTTVPPAAIGTHSETRAVQDTSVTPEQLAAFKARGWSDKDIERYKKNLLKYSR